MDNKKNTLSSRIKETIIFLSLCYILEYMHFVSFGFHKDMLMEHITSVIIDSLLLLILSGCFTFFNKKATYIIAAVIALLWVLPNVVYYRFFSQYLSFSCLQELGNLNGSWWYGYIDKAFFLSDITLIIALIIIILLCYRYNKSRNKKISIIKIIIVGIVIILISMFLIPLQRTIKWNKKYVVETLENAVDLYECNSTPLIYKYGIFRSQLYFNIKHFHAYIKLTDNDLQEISNYIESKNRHNAPPNNLLKDKNIVVILVESFLSYALDESINGHKVMPYLSSIVSEKGTYYNPNIHQNICAGESSDGQFIYLTGLLPIRNVITVTECLRSDIIGLPKLLHDSLGYSTCMSLPTNSSFYHQSEINQKYGIDRIESILDNGMFANDEQLFKIASQYDKKLKQPFFHILLTLSMHAPYDEISHNIDKWNVTFPKSFSVQLKNYLTLCHYTDKQIGRYIEHLKKNGLWENTMVVILSDHEAHDWLLCTDRKKIYDGKMPFIIANANINTDLLSLSDANQIDIFSTLLDLTGINCTWRGLGYSLLNNNYKWKQDIEKEYNLSEKIIWGNFFREINYFK